jgi:putative peptidoglycan lipid II flippase
VAAAFGTSDAFDAFIVAQLLPMAIVGILAGSLNAALIPTYIEVREQENPEAAQRLYTTTLMWNFILLLLLSAALMATVNLWLPLMASGFAPAKLALARRLVFWTMPVVLLTGFSTTWGAILNAGERFALVAIAPTLQPLAIILLLALFCRSWGIYSMQAGTVLGVLAETVVVGAALARRGHPLMPHWGGATEAFRKVREQYGASIAASFLVTGMPLVDQAFASTLGPRSNSLLNYGSKLVALVMSLGATALGTAVLPQLSRMAARHEWQGIRRFLRTYGLAILGLCIPCTLLVILLSPMLVRLMYQHGSFTADDTRVVVQIQILYLLRIPFSTTLILVTRTLKALRANVFLLYMSFGTFTINALLDWVFIKPFGIAGITLSTSACSVVVLTCLGIATYRLLDRKERENPA